MFYNYLQGLSDTNNYHEFCRLLARLKSNYQLGELVIVDSYPEAIQLIAKFTVDSLRVYPTSQAVTLKVELANLQYSKHLFIYLANAASSP